MCCTIRGHEVIIRSDDSERDTITVLQNSTYNVYVTNRVLNTRLSLIAVMLSEGSGGVVFKVGLDGCRASEVLGIH